MRSERAVQREHEPRDEAIVTLRTIAANLELSVSGTHHLLNRAEQQARSDAKFRLELRLIRDALKADDNPF